jgi:hypothetical protein
MMVDDDDCGNEYDQNDTNVDDFDFISIMRYF